MSPTHEPALQTTKARDVRNIAKRLRRRACRLTAARQVRVLHREGTFHIIVLSPEDGRTSHALTLPRYLRQLDEFSDLNITCEVIP